MEEIKTITDGLAISIDTIWILVAGILVMFMQPGFAMVEAGFTRSKNAANILMKNIMDFSVGSLMFWFIGYNIMYGTDIGGFIGMPSFLVSEGTVEGLTGVPELGSLFFQTVFAATAATIVSGAMAERTKFSAYLIFSLVITLIIYPISGHWVWGGGWLSEMGFHDFAGSTVVHSVGAWVGLMGAWIIGPRIGKYRNGKAQAIPGHNILIGTLGVFILWFGWFGFNPGSQLAGAGTENAFAISHIVITTNLAAAAGAVTAMIVSWVKFGKPGLSLTLNGALAGLVAITAGCAVVTPVGAVVIGIIAGFLLVFGVMFFEHVAKIDDPVGAVSVHGLNGAMGTIAVGLFANGGEGLTGLFYGGGASLLITQIIGVVAIGAWALGTGFILFKVLKATNGLRVTAREEEYGLDIIEHGEQCFND